MISARRALMAGVGMSLVWTAAQAKPPAKPAPDPRDAEIQLLKEQVQALAAKVDSLQAKVNAPPPAPPPPPPAPVAIIQTPAAPAKAPDATLSIAAGKPSIQSSDGRFSANLHAVMQFDAANYWQATPGPTTSDFRRGASSSDTSHARDLSSGTNFRRARLGVDGKAFGDWEYNVLLEFGGAGEEDAGHIQELWIQYSAIKPFHVRVGAFAPSVGLEDQGSTNGMLFLERPAPADVSRSLAGGDFREGAEVWAGSDRWYTNVAITGRTVGTISSTGSGVSQPFDSQLGYIGRAAFMPFKTDNGFLVLGLHGSYVQRPADTGGPDTAPGAVRYSIQMQERPELRVDTTRLISTGSINAQHATMYGLEIAGEWGGFYLQSEFDQYKIERLNPAAGVSNPDFHGWYVEGSYIFTGERRRFKPDSWSFDGPPVDHPFSLANRTWGAFEVAARYSDIDLNYHAGAPGTAPTADAVRGGEQQIWSGGLNWYANSFVRFMLDFQDVRILRLSPSASAFSTPNGVQVGQHYHVLELRSQFAF